MKRFSILASALVLGMLAVGSAEARNPHCAGGIQYLTQWRADKDKNNQEDYHRELSKSIQQLEMCSTEDPKDFEAMAYLGWSYAEADSGAAAGRAFQQAIDGLKSKGDKKSLELAINNRDSYWAIKFNDGIAKIKTAQELYPEFCKKPATPADETQHAAAAKKYDEAIVSLTKANQIKGGESRTMRNLATVHALRCEYPEAIQILTAAITATPNDSDLTTMMRQVRGNMASDLITAKEYDKAISFYSDLLKADPNNADLLTGLAEAQFEVAQSKQGDAKGPAFKIAGDAYARAAEIRKDPDLWFNAAIAFQNGLAYVPAENAWRHVLELRPNDPKALRELGSVLAAQKKFEEAIKTVHQAVLANAKDKDAHRQLGSVYTQAGNNQKGTEELMVFLTLQSGQSVDDVGAQAKKAPAGSAAAKTQASAGVPESIYLWVADGQKWESWFYWGKHIAYHFQNGVLVQKSDWTAPDLKTANK